MLDNTFNKKESPLVGMMGGGPGGPLGISGGSTADPTYVDDVFSTYLYDGDGSSSRTITNNIDISGEGGLVWVKQRNDTRGHNLSDTERGATKILSTNNNGGEGTYTTTITSFTSTGFSVGSDSGVNHSSGEYASWSFRKAPGFFDVITWTGDGVNGRQIAHDLGSTPGMSIIKCRSSSSRDFIVRHENMSSGKVCFMNSTSAELDNPGGYQTHSSTHLTLNTGGGSNGLLGVNHSGDTYVAYVFANNDASFGTDSDESIIKCGSYTGTGSYQTIDIGFEAQWVLIKRLSNTGDWGIFDIMRGAPSGDGIQANGSVRLRPNTTQTDGGSGVGVNSDGFILGDGSSEINTSGVTYIYMAIRRSHKPPTAGTDVFAITNPTSSGTYTVTAGFPIDSVWYGGITGSSSSDKWYAADRMRGSYLIRQNFESSHSSLSTEFDSMTQFILPTISGNYSGQISYCFKRASGFFDTVVYTGSGNPSSSTISHNLGVVPELLIAKRIDNGDGVWAVYSSVTGNRNYLRLNTNDASTTTSFWQNTDPTSTQFTVSNNNNVGNDANNYVAYLFASLNGISKVGSYTGTGNNINVDCGFAAGARFVLIKRTDSTGDWYLYDTTRGIVSGDDPYLLLNTYDAQVTNTDYIDPLNAGFTVTSSSPTALNASGGTYLFLAIA